MYVCMHITCNTGYVCTYAHKLRQTLSPSLPLSLPPSLSPSLCMMCVSVCKYVSPEYLEIEKTGRQTYRQRERGRERPGHTSIGNRSVSAAALVSALHCARAGASGNSRPGIALLVAYDSTVPTDVAARREAAEGAFADPARLQCTSR
jgi:hypothetical protein